MTTCPARLTQLIWKLLNPHVALDRYCTRVNKPAGLDENATGSKTTQSSRPFTRLWISTGPHGRPNSQIGQVTFGQVAKFSPTAPQIGNLEYIYEPYSPKILINSRLRLAAWVTPNHCYSAASSALFAKHSLLKHSPRHSTPVSSSALTPPQS